MPRFYVRCPFCDGKVPLPDDEMDDVFKVTECLDCSKSFDYEPEEVQENPQWIPAELDNRHRESEGPQ